MVVIMEAPTAFRRFLLEQPAVTGYVQDRVFRWHLSTHVDGTGSRAVVLGISGGWAAPNAVNTQEYPILVVEAWADCTRIKDGRGKPGDKARNDAVDNAWALFRVLDGLLHPMPRGRRWGAYGSDPGLLVVGGQRWTEPRHYDAETPDGSGRKFGEAAMVRGEYALQVVHERSA